MTRSANWLHDIEIDEVSLVDRPANQHARVAITKRAPEETVDYFNEQGEAVDLDDLEIGDVVYDAEQRPFQVEAEEAETDAETLAAREGEFETAEVGKSLAEQVREDLSKALGDVERDDVIAKAMGAITAAETRATEAENIAKSERNLRLTREYISKAAEYAVPGVTPAELGPVLMHAAESLSHADCVVLAKALSTAGAAFAELGSSGAADMNDPFGVIEELLTDGNGEHELSKALHAAGSDRHELIEKAFDADPAAYDRYLADRARG